MVNVSFADFCHDSAIQVSLIALAAPKVQCSMFNVQSFIDMEKKKDFAFSRMNFILLAIGVVAVVLGFVLMSGAGSTETEFNPEIFSAMRIKVAPAVCFLGFAFIGVAIMFRPKDKQENS